MPSRLPRNQQSAPDVRAFRNELNLALSEVDAQRRVWANAKWGVYVFYDWEGEPIYVGQTNEKLRVRVQRHLTNQRTDAVAMRVLDIFEVAEVALYPVWDFEGLDGSNAAAKAHLDALEYSVYLDAIDKSRFRAILNEKVPPVSPKIDLPPFNRSSLLTKAFRNNNDHLDIRLARRSETISRLASVVRERGEVSPGLRRVLVIQAVRLAYMSACRLAEVEGREAPDPAAFEVRSLIGVELFDGLI